MKNFIILTLLLTACGSKNDQVSFSPAVPSPVPPNVVHGSQNVHFIASRSGNSVNNGVFIITDQNLVTIPNFSDLTVTSNSAENYSTTIIIKNVTCVYGHLSGTNVYQNRNCSINTNSVAVTQGDTILITINAGPSNLTSVETDMTLEF